MDNKTKQLVEAYIQAKLKSNAAFFARQKAEQDHKVKDRIYIELSVETNAALQNLDSHLRTLGLNDPLAES